MLQCIIIGFLNVTFDFRPYENHYEVHRKYYLSSSGEEYVNNPHAVMSVDPQSNVVDVILGIVETSTFKRCHQNRGKQLKPRVIAALDGPWTEGSIDKIKFLGFGTEAQDYICLYFDNCFNV